ncbi:MAG TPA: hypothetical protein VFW87_13305 [Pirellulales bacterium]|nr:hypothetical protein [Pirellulales bacterium]
MSSVVDQVHRGLEWKLPLRKNGKATGSRGLLVRDAPEEDWLRPGIPPNASPFCSFECPPTKYISLSPEHERRSTFDCPWALPKIIMSSKRKSRNPWRIAAFVDDCGLAFYQTFSGIWPKNPRFLPALAAILNGPVANAFVVICDGSSPGIAKETLLSIPVPRFEGNDLETLGSLVATYRAAVAQARAMPEPDWCNADFILRRIDAAVLSGYDLSPRSERKLLDYFRGHRRPVPFSFAEYFPADFRPCVPLAEYLSDSFAMATADAVRRRYETPSAEVLRSIKAVTDRGRSGT